MTGHRPYIIGARLGSMLSVSQSIVCTAGLCSAPDRLVTATCLETWRCCPGLRVLGSVWIAAHSAAFFHVYFFKILGHLPLTQGLGALSLNLNAVSPTLGATGTSCCYEDNVVGVTAPRALFPG